MKQSDFKEGSIYRCKYGVLTRLDSEWWMECCYPDYPHKEVFYCSKVHGPRVGECIPEPKPCDNYSEIDDFKELLGSSELYDLTLLRARILYPDDGEKQTIYMAGFLDGCGFIKESVNNSFSRLVR